jgi:hypothetical protein
MLLFGARKNIDKQLSEFLTALPFETHPTYGVDRMRSVKATFLDPIRA